MRLCFLKACARLTDGLCMMTDAKHRVRSTRGARGSNPSQKARRRRARKRFSVRERSETHSLLFKSASKQSQQAFQLNFLKLTQKLDTHTQIMAKSTQPSKNPITPPYHRRRLNNGYSRKNKTHNPRPPSASKPLGCLRRRSRARRLAPVRKSRR